MRSVPSILELESLIRGLSQPARDRAERLFDVRPVTGRTDPPATLEPWLVERFGSVEAVREQRIVKVMDRATLRGTIFAPLRSRRPHDGGGGGEGAAERLAAEIDATRDDPFCDPEHATPADTFGRVRGRHAISGANAAMADAHHGVIVFERHDPLAFDAASIGDLLHLGRAWADRARATDPAATSYLLIWNCLWRAGGSIVHGHAQVLLGSGAHYARLEQFRRDAAAYAAATGHRYLDDLVAAHVDLGLAVQMDGVAVVASLTPSKERELLIVGPLGSDERDPAFATALARSVVAYREALGVTSFNLALWRPPLDAERAAAEGWDQVLPPVVHLVDRGDAFQRPSDIGAMELYATPIVGSDPFADIEALRPHLTAD